MATTITRNKGFGCEFEVHRTRYSPNVFSISLWKRSAGYVYNLSTSLLWWSKFVKTFFPDWNIRFYYDHSLFVKNTRDTTYWTELVENLKKRKNVELWKYNCIWGNHGNTNCQEGCHTGTFGSLVRFHPYEDNTVSTVIVSNLELLLSPKIARLYYFWLNNPNYTYFILFNQEYKCGYDKTLCDKLNLQNTSMLLATTGIKKPFDWTGNILNSFQKYIKSLEKTTRTLLEKYPYGVDEILLTKIIKPKMDSENTYAIYLYWSENLSKLNYIKSFAKLNQTITEYVRSVFQKDEYKGDTDIQTLLDSSSPIYRGLGIIDSLYKTFPNVAIDTLRYIKNQIKPTEYELETLNDWNIEASKYYVQTFLKNDTNEPELYVPTSTSIFEPRLSELLLYFYLDTVIFAHLDFPGYKLKNKQELKFKESSLSEPRIQKEISRIKEWEIGTPEEIREKAIKHIEDSIKQEKEELERYRKIFFKNVKSTHLFTKNLYTY